MTQLPQATTASEMDLQQHACTKTASIEHAPQTLGLPAQSGFDRACSGTGSSCKGRNLSLRSTKLPGKWPLPKVIIIVAAAVSPTLASAFDLPTGEPAIEVNLTPSTGTIAAPLESNQFSKHPTSPAKRFGRRIIRVLQTRQTDSALNTAKATIKSPTKPSGTFDSRLSATAELPTLPDTSTPDPERLVFDSNLANAIAAASQETSPVDSTDEQDPFDEKARRVFESASNGEFPDGDTGNIVLDDMLKVMRQTGPVSSRLASSRGFDEVASPLEINSNANARGDQIGKTLASRVRAAEQLLKAARLLEKQAYQLPSSVSLVDEMRITARKLLTEE